MVFIYIGDVLEIITLYDFIGTFPSDARTIIRFFLQKWILISML